MPEDIAGSEQMLANRNQSIQERAARHQEMATRVQGMTISERSRDGSVEILVGSNGIPRNLVIGESAASRQMAEIIGTQDETADVVFNEAKKNFFASPAEEPARTPYDRNEMSFRVEDDVPPARPAPPPPPRRRPPSDDADFGGESVLS